MIGSSERIVGRVVQQNNVVVKKHLKLQINTLQNISKDFQTTHDKLRQRKKKRLSLLSVRGAGAMSGKSVQCSAR